MIEAIAMLYEALAGTSDRLLQEYERFTEQMIAEGLPARLREVADGRATIVNGADDFAVLLDAARLLRALEQGAIEFSRRVESDRGEDLEDAWRTPDDQHFVIPRLTALYAVDGKPFLRRALLHHRVLPTQVDGFHVRLHRLSAMATAAARIDRAALKPEHFGAALFPGLDVGLIEPTGDEFLVESLTGFDAAALIDTHLDRARDKACVAIVWPELTMPQASVAMLKERLAAAALDGGPSLQFLVAGSWHRDVAGKMRNVSQILDGHGECLFEVMKWAKFSLGSRREAIVPGDEVHLLIGEDSVTVFAICRDFLQETKEVPYKRLNVDVAIVPSMLTKIDDFATMSGHASTAHTMRVRFGTRVLVVGQPARPNPPGVGRVMAFPARPTEQARGRKVNGAWQLCVLESP